MSYHILYPPIIIDAGPNAGVYFGGPKLLQWSETMAKNTGIPYRAIGGTTQMDDKQYLAWYDSEGNPHMVEQEEITRTVNTLVRVLGITSREDFREKVDEGADLADLDEIGTKRAPIVKVLHMLSPQEWLDWTGLPEHNAQPAILPQDSPEG